ncbi:hypothetical protein [Leptolyngbya sp. ST-U4]|uniref:hypothetical protein n=1 Tax=Leptolyngbya sp. ST-U4 TaxID=2933912 RepID=UPI003299DB56
MNSSNRLRFIPPETSAHCQRCDRILYLYSQFQVKHCSLFLPIPWVERFPLV